MVNDGKNGDEDIGTEIVVEDGCIDAVVNGGVNCGVAVWINLG